MTVAAAFLGALAVLLMLPSSLLLVQTLMAAAPLGARETAAGRRPRVAVLMPAHNEALLIAESIASVKQQLKSGDRLLIVADNCTDDTARIAAQHGAEVFERTDSERRGKGFALYFGIRQLAKQAPEVVVVVDADCTLGDGALETLARMAALEQRPVQALDLMRAPEGAGPLTRLAEFAWVVKNQVRPLGYQRLGLPCHLMGTGMAFPWLVVEFASLASGNIVEDLTLGLELARGGYSPRFCPEALVTSCFPRDSGVAEQRTRWEHGHLAAILQRGAKLVGAAIVSGDIQLLALALDLCVPPLALLALLLAVLLTVSLLFFAVSQIAWPAIIAASACAAFATAVLVAWWQFGRHIVSLGSLTCAAAYAVRKIPLYMRFITRRQVHWVRSRRKGE